jgi:hypothetical protein
MIKHGEVTVFYTEFQGILPTKPVIDPKDVHHMALTHGVSSLSITLFPISQVDSKYCTWNVSSLQN